MYFCTCSPWSVCPVWEAGDCRMPRCCHSPCLRILCVMSCCTSLYTNEDSVELPGEGGAGESPRLPPPVLHQLHPAPPLPDLHDALLSSLIEKEHIILDEFCEIENKLISPYISDLQMMYEDGHLSIIRRWRHLRMSVIKEKYKCFHKPFLATVI